MKRPREIIIQSLRNIGFEKSINRTESLNLDSLMIVLLVGELEKGFNKSIPLDKFNENHFNTVNSIEAFLFQNKVL